MIAYVYSFHTYNDHQNERSSPPYGWIHCSNISARSMDANP